MVIYDSRIIQRTYRSVRQLFKPQEIPKVDPEITTESKAEEATVNDVPEAKAQKEDVELGNTELPDLELDKLVPYSVRTSVIVLAIFMLSFAVIMAVRGFVPNVTPPFKFFANIFLAGTIICGNNTS